jgi:glucose-6-phosphate dehydrogenase assembly protein OpcA
VLGQSYPSAATATSLYTVPSSTSAVVSTINVANLASASDVVRIAVRPAGATLANQHYVAYNMQVPGTGVFTLTLGVTLATTDIITVYSNNGTSSFNAFGSEIS